MFEIDLWVPLNHDRFGQHKDKALIIIIMMEKTLC